MPPNPQVQAFSDKVNAFVAQINKSVDDIAADIATLQQKLQDMQNSAGTLSPDDQASLDAALALVSGVADKVGALDLANAPVAPVVTDPPVADQP